MVIAMHLLHARASGRDGAAHGQPVEQFHALGAGFFHPFQVAELRGPFGVGFHAAEELQVEALVDDAGALAFEPCRVPNRIFTPAARLQDPEVPAQCVRDSFQKYLALADAP